jgi:hypothetical protein
MSNKTDKNTDKNIDKDIIILNGPVNYIKLFNEKTKQSVWLFMDFHLNIDFQKKCDDYEAKDFYKYIYKKLSETNELIDFFLEINPSEIKNNYSENKNSIYIEETRKIFKKIYHEKYYSKENNKQNIRLHYIDIRDYSFFHDLWREMDSIFSLLRSYSLNNLDMVIEKITKVKDILIYINKIIDIIRTNENNFDEKKFYKIDYINVKIDSENKNFNFNEIQEKGFTQLLYKIIVKYSNDDNKKNINNYFDINYLANSINLIKYLENFIEKLHKINKRIQEEFYNMDLNIENIVLDKKLKLSGTRLYYGEKRTEYDNDYFYIYSTIEKIDVVIVKLGCVFMDCFFLRRLIEKNYISKSIVYTGGYHSTVYTWFLIKYCGYKIEEYQYINMEKLDKSKPIDNLYQIINKSNNSEDILTYLIPKKLSQCIKIKQI